MLYQHQLQIHTAFHCPPWCERLLLQLLSRHRLYILDPHRFSSCTMRQLETQLRFELDKFTVPCYKLEISICYLCLKSKSQFQGQMS